MQLELSLEFNQLKTVMGEIQDHNEDLEEQHNE
jgi:hypothetical protein